MNTPGTITERGPEATAYIQYGKCGLNLEKDRKKWPAELPGKQG